MAELPTGTVTFLFTDIEGSTRLLKELRARYQEVLEAHQRILRETLGEHDGTEIDTQGDSFFFAFRRAREAVAAAAAAQRALADHDWPEGMDVRVRMGLHTGEPMAAGERYVGIVVHRAARISAAGHGGQVLLSNTTRELVEDDLPQGVALRDLGESRLKDIDRPERIFQLELEGFSSDFPPLKTLKAETPFAGREAELEAAAGAAIARLTRLSRRGLVLAALAGAIVAAAVVVPIYSLGGDSKLEVRAFVGTWTSVDEDRSNQALRVTHRPEAESYYLTLEDDAATACGGASVTGEGTGTVVGNRLSGTLRLSCASGARLQFSWWVIYSSADDTLVDKEGVIWSRTKKPPTDRSRAYGDLFWATLPMSDGGTVRRIVVVVSRLAVNRKLKTVVADVTTTARIRSLPTSFEVEATSETGLPEASYVVCHELATVDREMLDPEPIGGSLWIFSTRCVNASGSWSNSENSRLRMPEVDICCWHRRPVS